MVSSVTTQQIPAANTFQPGGSDATTKKADETKVDDSSRQQNAAQLRAEKAAETRNSEPSYKAAANDATRDSGQASANKTRGQTLDITV